MLLWKMPLRLTAVVPVPRRPLFVLWNEWVVRPSYIEAAARRHVTQNTAAFLVQRSRLLVALPTAAALIRTETGTTRGNNFNSAGLFAG